MARLWAAEPERDLAEWCERFPAEDPGAQDWMSSSAEEALGAVLNLGSYYAWSSIELFPKWTEELADEALEARWSLVRDLLQLLQAEGLQRADANLSQWDLAWAGHLRGLGRSAQALEFSMSAERVDLESHRATWSLLRADLQREEGRSAQALAELQGMEALELNLDEASFALSLRCQVLVDAGRFELARELMIQEVAACRARALDPSVTDPVEQTCLRRALQTAAKVEQAGGLWASAAGYLQEWLDLPGQVPAREATGFRFRLGRALWRSGDLAGHEHIEAAIAEGLPPKSLVEAHTELARISLRAGQWEPAAEQLALARAVSQELRGTGLVRGAEDLEALELDLALERGTAGADLEPMRERLEAALLRLRDRWREQPEVDGGTGTLAYRSRRSSLGAWLRVHVAMNPVVEALELAMPRLFELQCAALGKQLTDPEAAWAECRRALLADSSGVLLYVLDSSGGHVVLMDAAGGAHATLGPLEDLVELIHDHRALLRTPVPQVAKERELATRLAQELLPDTVTARLSSLKRLWVCGLSDLGSPPLEWLPAGRADYLIETLPVLRLHHLADVHAEPQPAVLGEPRWDLVLAADPEFESQHGLQPIDLTKQQLEYLVSAYEPSKRRTLTHSDFSLEGLQQVCGEGVRVAEFLTHSVPAAAGGSALLVTPTGGEGGELDRRWVAGLRAPEVVLLFACATGRSASPMGSAGAGSLTGAWLRAGSTAVLATQIAIPLQSAAQLSSAFHVELRQGYAPAAAFRRGLLTCIDGDRQLAPFRYGLAHLTGPGHQALFPAAAQPAGWLRRGAWLVLALALCGLVYGRLRSGRARAQ